VKLAEEMLQLIVCETVFAPGFQVEDELAVAKTLV